MTRGKKDDKPLPEPRGRFADYLDYLIVEKGLSANTVAAYRTENRADHRLGGKPRLRQGSGPGHERPQECRQVQAGDAARKDAGERAADRGDGENGTPL